LNQGLWEKLGEVGATEQTPYPVHSGSQETERVAIDSEAKSRVHHGEDSKNALEDGREKGKMIVKEILFY